MNTPIHDFLYEYSLKRPVRCHMPGGKGRNYPFDITEIKGADCLYEATGIIGESEDNAARLYGSGAVCYSCGGSTLSIQTMLALAKRITGKSTVIAGRYSHRSFINSCVMLDLKPKWVYPERFLSSVISPEEIECIIDEDTAAVFINSIDYYGGVSDIKGISRVCKEKGVFLLADNAHGAYTVFTGNHPITLGADMSADSAHKTLPALTGTSLLHLKDKELKPVAKELMAIFGSTSPSYLMLESLDLCNNFVERGDGVAKEMIKRISDLKNKLIQRGIILRDSDPMRITINANRHGYTGFDFAEELRSSGVECEMCDEKYVVLLFSVAQPPEDFDKVFNATIDIRKKLNIKSQGRDIIRPAAEMTPREAFFSESETIPLSEATGRICSGIVCPCPPCIPMAMPGEIISHELAALLKKYNAEEIRVVK